MRLLGGADGHGHDNARADEEPLLARQGRVAGQHAHDVLLAILSRAVMTEIEECLQTGQRRTDEVHEVVARKGHGERERAEEHDDFEDVHFEQMQHLHQYGKRRETHEQDSALVRVNPIRRPADAAQDLAVAQATHEQEVKYRSNAHAAKYSDAPAKMLLVVECEHDTRNPHHD